MIFTFNNKDKPNISRKKCVFITKDLLNKQELLFLNHVVGGNE